jgi:hypothetical protein
MTSFVESFEVISKDTQISSQVLGANQVHCDDCHENDFDEGKECCLVKHCHISFYFISEKVQLLTQFQNLFTTNWEYCSHYLDPYLKTHRKPPLFA